MMGMKRDRGLIGHAVDAERDRICQIIRRWGRKYDCSEDANEIVDLIRGVEQTDDRPRTHVNRRAIDRDLASAIRSLPLDPDQEGE